MDTATLEAPGIGHNSLAVGEDLIDRLQMDHTDLLERWDQLHASEARMPVIKDEESARKVSDYIDLINGLINRANAEHKKVKEPYLTGGRQVDEFFFRGVRDPATDLKKRVSMKLKAYMDERAAAERRAREEAERAAREEAERKAREAAEAAKSLQDESELEAAIAAEEEARQAEIAAAQARQAAAAKASELASVKGTLGRTKSLKTFWDFADLNRDAIDLNKLRPYLPMDGLEKAVRAYIAAGGRDLPGVRIFENTRL
jgi:flagellar biosynthesis GTPase FlhF